MIVNKKLIQPEINIGLVGHVDNGKTTLVSQLSGKWTDTHSEEMKRGITIRLGYADAIFYECSKCKGDDKYSSKPKCDHCKGKTKELRKVSFIDAPGHETLMATMLCGAAIMDAALLLIAANEKCPQPQTREHLMALEIIGIKNIIVVQNKIDLVSKEDAIKSYNDIKKFLKGTIAENAPIIPISAQHGININTLIRLIEENFKTPKRDLSKDPIMLVARSFDVNKPGAKIDDLIGGVLGGALKQGKLKVGDKVEIKPGIRVEKHGRFEYTVINTEIKSLYTGSLKVDEVTPGGSVGVATLLDPSIVKADSLTGNLIGKPGKLPEVRENLILKPTLLERVVGSKEDLKVEPLKKGEALMLNINSAVTSGVVVDISKDKVVVKLKLSVCADIKDRVTISRIIGNRWRLIGYADMIEE